MVGAVQIGADIWKAAIINIGKLFAPVSSKKGKKKKGRGLYVTSVARNGHLTHQPKADDFLSHQVVFDKSP